MFQIPVFGKCRALWEQDEQVSESLKKCDDLAAKRNQGRQRFPELKLDQETGRYVKCLNAMCRDLQLPKRDERYKFYHDFCRCLLGLQPFIESARWVRWIHLERALAIAAASGDLLTSALVLRTQIEELAVLSNLDKYARQTPCSLADLERKTRASTIECGEIRRYAELVKDRLLPRTQRATEEELTDPKNPPKKPRDLDFVFHRLNDYVHPNYGSHIVLITPERSAVASVLVDAFVAVYQQFFSLDWSSDIDGESEANKGKFPAIQTAQAELYTFLKRTIHELEGLAQQFDCPHDTAWIR